MELFKIENLSFAYPDMNSDTKDKYLDNALSNINLTVRKGEFIVIMGASGCGKTTLLRQLKPIVSPRGNKSGAIYYNGKNISEMSEHSQAVKLGFVMQDVDAQLVTDKVWHELAFGLESLGFENDYIRRRVAEMSSFFGLSNIFHSKVTELSGGTKQLVNLAAVMATNPDVLILDEPTSQLDPIAANEFISSLVRINMELGTTIIMTEHRLEEVLPLCSRAIIMDAGSIVADDNPCMLAKKIQQMDNLSSFAASMPAAVQIYLGLCEDAESKDMPLTVNDGRSWLNEYDKTHEKVREYADIGDSAKLSEAGNNAVVTLKDVFYRYSKENNDVLRGLSLSIYENEILIINGGNGSGKSTLLSIISGIRKPSFGKCKLAKGKTVGMLPQDPTSLFTGKSVRQELSFAEDSKLLSNIVALCHLEKLFDRHPFDLSGGEQQRLALARVLMGEPDIILMDEPTKGLDNGFKIELAGIIKMLQKQGKTIVIVSHDIEFSSMVGDRAALLFDGDISAIGDIRNYLTGNSFYTTAASRIARGIVDNAITADEIVEAYRKRDNDKNKDKNKDKIEDIDRNRNKLDYTLQGHDIDLCVDSSNIRDIVDKDNASKKISPIRLFAIFASLIVIVYCFIQTVSQLGLNRLIKGMTVTEQGRKYVAIYAVFIIAIICLFIALMPFGKKADKKIEYSRVRKINSKATIINLCIVLVLIPFTIWLGYDKLQDRKYLFISLLVLIESMVPFFISFESKKPRARDIVMLSVMCAIAVAGRAAFFMLPNFSPVIAIVIIAGVGFGGEAGFITGAITMLVSNVIFGQGPWTPWQMFSLGLIGFLSGLIYAYKGVRLKLLTKVGLCIFGALACIIIYGGIMNPASVIMWQKNINLQMLLASYITGFPFDIVEAVATVLFLWLAATPFLEKLDRVRMKYGIIEGR